MKRGRDNKGGEGSGGRLIPYIRCSSDESAILGSSPGAQRDALEALGTRLGLPVSRPFQESEGVSGGAPIEKCPQLLAAIGELKAGDVLGVWKRDRIARDQYKVLALEKILERKKARLVSSLGEGTHTEDPHDIGALIQRRVSDLFAEIERLNGILRALTSAARKRGVNERVGQVPYGWELYDDGRRSKPRRDREGKEVLGNLPIALRPVQAEQRVIKISEKLRLRGWTYARIAQVLNARAVPTKRGGPWSKDVVRQILNRVEKFPCQAVTEPDPPPLDRPGA